VTVPLEVIGSGGDAEPGPVVDGERIIEGRSLGQIAWMRLKRDRVAIGGGIVIVVLILVAVFAPLIVKLLGHPPKSMPTGRCRSDGSAASVGTSYSASSR
jgi:N-terminal TM domain of oligopeptide transport permease C